MHTSLILLVVFLLNVIFVHLKLKKCPDSKLFWSAFSRIWTEYGKILRISPYSVRMQENAGKIWTRITPNTDTFCAVIAWDSLRLDNRTIFGGKLMVVIKIKEILTTNPTLNTRIWLKILTSLTSYTKKIVKC